MDSEAAFKRISNLWRRLGAQYEKAATALMERGQYESAMDCARKAEVCFWQATGDLEPLNMRDLGYSRSAEGR